MLRRALILVTVVVRVAASPTIVVGSVEVFVKDRAGLESALAAARPGARIRLAPGDYAGGLSFHDLAGTEAKPIIVAAADPAHPPRIVGGTNGLQLSDVAHLTLEDLVFTGATGNGINVDDAGTFETPSHHVTIRRVSVLDVAADGNHDGIKLSGLDDFRLEDCRIHGWGGQGVDMVGCHRGVIDLCRFVQRDVRGTAGVQAKGGSSAIVVRSCTFNAAIDRGVNLGGSTGLAYFRPRVLGYEAKDLVVEQCVFDGCQTAVAFVGVDGAIVRFNTIYRPGRWAMRILQETTDPAFVPSRGGVFEDNVVVFRSDRWSEGGVNVGPRTAPETFRFARNVWYCEDRLERSRPTLPTQEVDGLVGVDPMFKDAEKGDLTLKPGSPAAGRGATPRRDR
jgi:hypothetical protein